MAGIVGHIGENIKNEGPNLLVAMTQAIKYVNSDITDSWQDEHIAISRVHHGIVNSEKQPIFNEDKSLLIFMDGEVYDYEADKQFLLNQGHRFQYSHNDAEFCLHLYEELGKDCFLKLNGSFLVTIYNLHTKELLIINDRFSSRPFFYCLIKGCLVFGAQLRAVLKSNKVPRNLDRQAVIEFFTFQKVMGDKTYYQEVKVIPPATIMRFMKGQISLTHYWQMRFREDRQKSKAYYVNAMPDVLRKAVRRRTNDNRRYGILLSGGLDSRAILAASESPMTAFTIADFENKELKIANEISKAKNCKHIYLKRDPNHYPNLVEKAVDLGDGMYSFFHAHFVGFFDRIREECDVLLYGCSLGALFQGAYLPRWNINFFGKTISLPLLEVPSEKTLLQTIFKKYYYSLWDRKPDHLFNKDFFADFSNALERSVYSKIKNYSNITTNLSNMSDYFVLYFISKHSTFLNELCIRPHIEERLIIFDNDLLDFYLEMPPELRFNSKIYKKAINILNPQISHIINANTGISATIPGYLEWVISLGNRIVKKIRPPQLPSPTVKQTSWPNMPELIRHNDKLKQLIGDVINDEQCIDSAIFNREALIEMFNKHLCRQGDYTEFLFLALTFGIWHKKYGPRK